VSAAAAGTPPRARVRPGYARYEAATEEAAADRNRRRETLVLEFITYALPMVVAIAAGSDTPFAFSKF
jgi:hypothetical protein